MTNPITNKRWHWPLALIAISLLALAMRWYYVSSAMVLNPIRGDATQYYAYAWNLANHGIFAKNAPGSIMLHPDNYRDPGYPIFLALWMKLFGTGDAWYAAVLLCQALLGALTVTMATQLGKCWLPTSWAAAAGLLMAVWPHSITINGYLLTETLVGFLCVLGLLLLARSCMCGNIWLAGIAGLTLGAAALTNAVLLPFGALLAGILAWHKLMSSKLCLVLVTCALMLPSGWALRNAHIPHPSIDNSSTGRAMQNFVQGAWPEFHPAYRQAIVGDATVVHAQAQDTLRAVKDEYILLWDSPRAGAKAIARRLSQHPWRYALWYLVEKPQELWGWGIVIGQGDLYVYPTANSPFQTSPPWIVLAAICHALNPLLMLTALIGGLVAWRRHQKLQPNNHTHPAALVSTACLLAFITLVYTTLQAEPRYSIPFRAFELLLSVTACWQVTAWVRKHANRSVGRTYLDHNRPPSTSP
jgi:hypothetical protein